MRAKELSAVAIGTIVALIASVEFGRPKPIASTVFETVTNQARTSAPKRRALLVGIDRYLNLPTYSISFRRTITNLRGASNDVREMQAVLTTVCEFRPEDVRTLTNSDASRDAIIQAFQDWLVRGTKPGDLALFYFTGHGTQVLDQNGDEDDGFDEALCPYDIVPNQSTAEKAKVLLDDKIGEMIMAMKDRTVVFIADACFSGTLTRGFGSEQYATLESTPARSDPKYMWPVRGILPPSNVTQSALDVPGSQIEISSCRADQESVEISFANGEFHGAFTSAMVEGLRQRKSMTYGGLIDYARRVVSDRYRLGHIQNPQLRPDTEAIRNHTAFSPISFSSVTQVADTWKPSQTTQSERLPTPTSAKLTPKPQQSSVKPKERPPEVLVPVPNPPPEETSGNVLIRLDKISGASEKVMTDLQSSLMKLPYVEITHDGLFDRLIRGQTENGVLQIRVLNRVGDVISVPPTRDTDRIVKELAGQLEYAYIVKQLARIWTANPSFKAEISVVGDQRDFKLGDKIVYRVFVEEDSYVLLLNLDSQGNLQIIYPNQYHRDNFVRGGSTIEIPDQEMRRKYFEFQFWEPAGEETVKLIATNKQLDLGVLRREEFGRLFHVSSGSGTTLASPARALVGEITSALETSAHRNGFRWSQDMVVARSYKTDPQSHN
jgi:hypothetical protein